MNTIHYTIPGEIPQKNFVLKRIDGKIEQNLGSKQFEFETKQAMKKANIKGWLSQEDLEYGEYTPLKVEVKIYTTRKNAMMIKQLKTLLDALTGVVYMDDCTVVDLYAEKILSDKAYTEIKVMPADKSYVQLPNERPVILNRYLKPLQNTVFDIAGYPLDIDKYKKDKEYKEYIRKEFAAQLEELIDGQFEIFAVIGALELKERTPLTLRRDAYNLDFWPITTPDADNSAYCILQALQKYEYDNPEDLVRLRVIKTYYNPDAGRNRIWMRNTRTKNDMLILDELEEAS